jgi:hypothetical protein
LRFDVISTSVTSADVKTKYSAAVALSLSAYVCSYLAMSLSGVYQTGTVGTNGIKDWNWIPSGFADKYGRLHEPIAYLFLPLFALDNRYWHNDWTGTKGPSVIPPKPPKRPSPTNSVSSSSANAAN